jgi:hypothetical protein
MPATRKGKPLARTTELQQENVPFTNVALRKDLNLLDAVAIVVGTITDGWVPGFGDERREFVEQD